VSIHPERLLCKRAARRAYTLVRYRDAMERAGATEAIFAPGMGNATMDRTPRVRVLRRKVWEIMLEPRDGRKVSPNAIAEHIGIDPATICHELRRPPPRCLTMADAIQIRDAAYLEAGCDPTQIHRYGTFPERDHAVWLMRRYQPCGLRLSLKTIALIVWGIEPRDGRGSPRVCNCLDRHEARRATNKETTHAA